MVKMTDAVGTYLTTMLEQANAPPSAAIRIELHGDDALAPLIDDPRPDDARLEYQGRTVLVLDARTNAFLAESMLDVDETPEGPKLLVLQ